MVSYVRNNLFFLGSRGTTKINSWDVRNCISQKKKKSSGVTPKRQIIHKRLKKPLANKITYYATETIWVLKKKIMWNLNRLDPQIPGTGRELRINQDCEKLCSIKTLTNGLLCAQALQQTEEVTLGNREAKNDHSLQKGHGSETAEQKKDISNCFLKYGLEGKNYRSK